MNATEKRYRKAMAEHERGASLASVAKRLGIKTSTLSWWKSELRRRDRQRAKPKPKANRLLPARIPLTPPPAKPRFEVALPSGPILRVPPGFDGEDFARLIDVLQRNSC